ncbi:hypothetical protein [Chryseobacterium schmidteae]|uniref:hypothetical protein n=1 Tax=Chryseobacterium schmidteae TaxID=2730404 RepID=UPI0015884F42|nr:hypothetical protein [Chryseobacterium schmidteae]
MHYEISEKAQQDLLSIEEYLLEEWGIDILVDFFCLNIILLFIITKMMFCIFTGFFKTFRIQITITNH